MVVLRLLFYFISFYHKTNFHFKSLGGVFPTIRYLESSFPTADALFGRYGFADIATCRNPYTKLTNCDTLLPTLKGRKKAENEPTVPLEQLTTLLLERNGLLQRLSNI